MTAAPILARTLKYTVTISRGENSGKVYSFEKSVVTIGRGSENDIVLSEDVKVSRSHLALKISHGQVLAKNISEKNFVLIDGDKYDEKAIDEKAQIQLGGTILQLKIDVPPPAVVLSAAPSASPANLRLASASDAIPMLGNSATTSPSTDFRPMPPPLNKNSFSYATDTQKSDSRVTFYGIILILGACAAWFVMRTNATSSSSAQGDGVPLISKNGVVRTEADVMRKIEESANKVLELRKQQENSAQNTVQYQAAQEHYIKGFRDYRQKQYARAIQSFQAALSFYPQHELARKYYVQAQRKFDESIDQSMSLGRKYYKKQNFQMCQSSFAQVMIMLKDTSKPKYREAKQMYDECSLRLEGRY